MIRGLSPIPRGGGKPEGKEGDCIPMLGALRSIEGVWVRTKLMRGVPTPGNTATPSCGFPQKSFPPEGPHDFRGHLRRSRRSDIAAEENSSADYATCRHAPRPKGEQRARGCVLFCLKKRCHSDEEQGRAAPSRQECITPQNRLRRCSRGPRNGSLSDVVRIQAALTVLFAQRAFEKTASFG